ncbi:MAG: hypothetical protein ACTSYM_01945 [Candidatus Baldrarchaeia archaeon]
MKVPTLELIKFEYKLLINDFKQKIRRSENILAYIILLTGTLSMFSLLYSFLFILPEEIRIYFLLSLTALHLDPYQLFLTTMNVLLFLFILKGILSPTPKMKCSQTDLEVIFPLPIDFKSLYLAKYLKTLPKTLIIDSIILFILTPLLWYFEITPLKLTYLVIAVIIFSLFLQLLEIISHFITTSLMRSITNKYLRISLIIITAIISGFILFLIPYVKIKTDIINILPSKSLTDIFFLSLSPISNLIPYLTRITHMLSSFLILLLISYFLAGKVFGDETNIEGKIKTTKLPILLGKASWNLLKVKRSFLIIIKDFWIDLRSQYIVYLLVGVTASIVIFLVKDIIKLPETTFLMTIDIRVFIVLFLLLLFIFSLSPSIHSFLNEMKNLWILKSLPILPIEIVIGKFIYSLISTTTILTPVTIALISLLPPLERNVLAVFIPFVYLLSSAEGILSDILFITSSERIHIPLTLFIFYISLLFVTIYPLMLLVYSSLYKPILLFITGTIVIDLFILLTYKFLRKTSKLLIQRDDLE